MTATTVVPGATLPDCTRSKRPYIILATYTHSSSMPCWSLNSAMKASSSTVRLAKPPKWQPCSRCQFCIPRPKGLALQPGDVLDQELATLEHREADDPLIVSQTTRAHPRTASALLPPSGRR